jgi:hypothetical protein
LVEDLVAEGKGIVVRFRLDRSVVAFLTFRLGGKGGDRARRSDGIPSRNPGVVGDESFGPVVGGSIATIVSLRERELGEFDRVILGWLHDTDIAMQRSQ